MTNPTAIVLLLASLLEVVLGQSGVPALGSEYNDVNKDGSYRYGFQTGDAGAHYQAAVANGKNQVAGRFGSWDPEKRRIVDTEYTSGRRGFRARGPNIARKMDLSQAKIPYNPPVSPNSPNYKPTYDGYHDPNEDPSYSFNFRSPTYSKQEVSDALGHVNGAYYYYDDVGERHDVTYEAGAKTGFNVHTPFPDSKVFNGLYYKGPAKPGGKSRGKTSIQQRLDGSYRFVASGPDQRRTEVSDSSRNVRGSYTYVDDKGQQRTVEYIAGPNIGYRIVKKGIGPNFPPPPPFVPPPPNFTDLPDVILPTPKPTGGIGGSRPFGGKPTRPGTSDNYGSGESFGGGDGPFGGGDGPNGDISGNRPPGFGSDKGPGGNLPPGSGSDEDGSGENTGGYRPPGGVFSPDEDRGPPGSSGDADDGYPPGSGEVSGSGWTTPTKPSPPSQSPFFPDELFNPTVTVTPKPGKNPPKYPILTPPPTPPPTIITSSTTDVPFTGYPNGRPNPGTNPFSYPNNCCGGSTTSRPDLPVSAFPEDDPSRPHRPPRPGQTDDFLQVPFEDLPPKDYPSYKPVPTSPAHPNYYYKPSGQGDNTFLSSNKNYFSFPSGVAVRAHIQSLDILPFGSRIPPPGLALEQGFNNNSRG